MTYPPAGSPYPPGGPPPVSSAELRPGRAGYWIAAAIAVLGVLVGCGLGALGFFSLAGDVPTMEREFAAGAATTVELESGKEWAIYVDNPGLRGRGQTGSAALPEVECTGTATDGGTITLTRPQGNVSFGDSERYWQLAYQVSVDKTGSYQMQCSSPDPGLSDPTFGVGPNVNAAGVVGKVFGSLGALFGIPCLAFVVAGVIALVVGMRRSSYKKRLQAQRGYGPVP